MAKRVLDPRTEQILNDLETFAETVSTVLIPVGRREKDVQKAVKDIKKKIKLYKKGKIEIFNERYYEMLENEQDFYSINDYID